jgi:hypothetical protein
VTVAQLLAHIDALANLSERIAAVLTPRTSPIGRPPPLGTHPSRQSRRADWQHKRYSPEHRARRLQRQLEALGFRDRRGLHLVS